MPLSSSRLTAPSFMRTVRCVLADLQRYEEALADLHQCLQLYPAPADRLRIEDRLEGLRQVA